MFSKDNVLKIVDSVASKSGLVKGEPISVDSIKSLVASAIYETVTSRDFMYHVSKSLAKRII